MDATLVHSQVSAPVDSPATIEALPAANELAVVPSPRPITELLDAEPYLFTADQFTRMVEADVFPDEDRVELWGGKVYVKMAKLRAHSLASALFIESLVAIKPAGWYLNAEESINLDPRGVPLPDLLLVRGRPRDYPEAHPTGRDVGLIVELSCSSIRDDTGPKLRGYARAGVPQYWVANLVDGILLVHRDPIVEESRYGTVETYRPGEVAPLLLDGLEIGRIAVSDLLP